jgi:hypothetical protein
MNLADLTKLVRTCVETRVPVMLSGPPGAAKTESLEQLSTELEAGFVPVAVATRPAEDFSGIAVPENMVTTLVTKVASNFAETGEVQWGKIAAELQKPSASQGVRQEPMSWLTRAIRLGETRPGGCIVLLDEFGCAKASTQAAMLSLVQSRYCGDTRIPPTVAFVAATNPVDQSAGGWELPLPTISRWVHVPWPGPSTDEWTSWLLNKSLSGSAEVWRGKAGQEVRALVAGFLNKLPHLLCEVPSYAANNGAYPCPRSWFNGALLLAALRAQGCSATLQHTALSGAVGSGVSTQFFAWVEESGLPDPDEILRDPKAWTPPAGRADKTMAILLGVTYAVAGKPTQTRVDKALDAIIRAADAGQAGVAITVVKPFLTNPAILPFLKEPTQLAALTDILGLPRF